MVIFEAAVLCTNVDKFAQSKHLIMMKSLYCDSAETEIRSLNKETVVATKHKLIKCIWRMKLPREKRGGRRKLVLFPHENISKHQIYLFSTSRISHAAHVAAA